MDLRPRLDQPALGLRQAAAEALECLDHECCGVFLIVRVKVRVVMRLPASTNMRMTMPKNRESSGTPPT